MLCHILALAVFVVSVSSHGRVLGPPSRASMWRKGFPTKPNYDDHGLNCGGFGHQFSTNKGKCGLCGDPWDAPDPKRHELGGEYGSGLIVATYHSGQVFTAEVEITVHHKGYWYFKICPDPHSKDQACFDKYPVYLEKGGKYFFPPTQGLFKVKYRLPQGLVCDHCVLQWRYVAGNNWGHCGQGRSGLGCGPQETFGACSDITIKGPKHPIPEGGPESVAPPKA
ncbi:uncharacterized protein LOC112050657 [Bicyclus anynana]|uniref:Uncharacterized protein LOC112050657 n=1 Tax=Bicyclus anynana TaxID=110368 RepID=A0A6J1NCW2_BICAN|nr:uncharacterized protein LOC112050657 [Bicyclus anynana]XP_023944734.1 uncharacterized protein LOC112050657 [Bicyclus anynana]